MQDLDGLYVMYFTFPKKKQSRYLRSARWDMSKYTTVIYSEHSKNSNGPDFYGKFEHICFDNIKSSA